jgi:hypothetical protein
MSKSSKAIGTLRAGKVPVICGSGSGLGFGVKNTPNRTPKRFAVRPECPNRTWVQFRVQRKWPPNQTRPDCSIPNCKATSTQRGKCVNNMERNPFWYSRGKHIRILKEILPSREGTLFPETRLNIVLSPLSGASRTQSTQTRDIARTGGLYNASREESVGICFVGERRCLSDFFYLVRTSSLLNGISEA